MRLKDRIALLTAAAGAGIGQATARTMAKEGASVVVMQLEIPVSETRSVCPVCLLTIPATLVQVEHDIVMRKHL